MHASFSDFIDAKGQDTICSALAWPPSTIRGFRAFRMIPRKRWPELLHAFPELGMSDLMRMETQARKRIRKAATK